MIKKVLFTYFVFILSFMSIFGQEGVIAHSHNDYKQKEPLNKALSLGYTSIEIDIWRQGSTIRVSHDKVALKRAPKIEEQYFDPLATYLQTNPDSKIWLLIDVKKDDGQILDLLHELVNTRSQYFQKRDEEEGSKPLKIILSGDFSRAALSRSTAYPYFFLDGRKGSLTLRYESQVMPLISENFAKVIKWSSKTEIDPTDRSEIRSIVASVHAQGKKLRFWNTPDNEMIWNLLTELGVDVIGVDDLEAFASYRGITIPEDQ